MAPGWRILSIHFLGISLIISRAAIVMIIFFYFIVFLPIFGIFIQILFKYFRFLFALAVIGFVENRFAIN